MNDKLKKIIDHERWAMPQAGVTAGIKRNHNESLDRIETKVRELLPPVMKPVLNKSTTCFYKARGFCSEYFIIGNPRKNKGSYVFHKNTQTRKVTHYIQIGVFDDYEKISQIPKWVKNFLLDEHVFPCRKSYKAEALGVVFEIPEHHECPKCGLWLKRDYRICPHGCCSIDWEGGEA